MNQAWRIGLAGVAMAVTIGVGPVVAHAVPEFPRGIERNLSLDYEPPCFLCHVKDKTGLGTAESPFALSMRDLGLSADDHNSLTTALTALTNEKIDSDGDGVDDIDELKAGTDPNTDAPASLRSPTEPSLGCRATPYRRDTSAPLAVFGVVLLLRFVGRRRAVHGQSTRPVQH